MLALDSVICFVKTGFGMQVLSPRQQHHPPGACRRPAGSGIEGETAVVDAVDSVYWIPHGLCTHTRAHMHTRIHAHSHKGTCSTRGTLGCMATLGQVRRTPQSSPSSLRTSGTTDLSSILNQLL